MANTKSPAKKKTGRKSNRKAENPEPALREFFVEELRDIYWAEKKLVTALPKMQKAATSEELKTCIADHIATTKEQVARLEKIFGMLEERAVGKKCEALVGILEEGNGILEDTEPGSATRDVGIILASQKIEHYEIATYGGLATLAATLGLDDVKELLGETLAEEKEADELLTSVAEESINYEAAMEEEA